MCHETFYPTNKKSNETQNIFDILPQQLIEECFKSTEWSTEYRKPFVLAHLLVYKAFIHFSEAAKLFGEEILIQQFN